MGREVLSCRDKNGTYKGLINICKKLGLIDENIKSNDITLDQLRKKLLDHQAFNNENTHFQKLAKDNGFKILVGFRCAFQWFKLPRSFNLIISGKINLWYYFSEL
ncbi:hypothetical protein BpHYR1_015262 [Brachionus plicatilis]|uniref:Uncharacterized protein n=1 Tax=Brachionus plicatilis TaxID=10195 RepID=A0A3M7Q3M2_BRAPC|nr:hypothetical protein BpHYR1_015262 [Brachionus plicatilis]